MQKFTEYLPPACIDLVRTRASAEFATVSGAGVPIDTPTYVFPSPDFTTFDIGTGLAYPAKAERARRNPKVGMLFEGEASQPVISIAGHAAVRDSDIQTNLERYLAETIFQPNVDPDVVPWEMTRKRLYYLARIIVTVAPVHVRWWPNRAAMDGPPQEWRADPGTVFPASDPIPSGRPSAAPNWPQMHWRELADRAANAGTPAHLTLLDSEGYPLSFRAVCCQRSEEGFRLTMPAAAPWSEGKATLSFFGKEIFVGDAVGDGKEMVLHVERALPVLPMMNDRENMSGEDLDILNARLAEEMDRRGQPIPRVPDVPPLPTEGATIRAETRRAIDANGVGYRTSR